MAKTDTWSIGRLLEWTSDYLAERGSDSPRLDAELLLAEARGCRRIELYTAWDEMADEKIRTKFRELVRRRGEGEPVAYLIGRREFYSLEFSISEHVLIPRPETEFLVVRLLDLVHQTANSPQNSPTNRAAISIADVGTGSGVLAVCAAKHVPQARVTALDSSSQAIDVARKNAVRHAVADCIEFVESDLFSALPKERRFDFILANPPYVTTAEMQELPSTVRNYEPHAALHGGEDGLSVIRPLVEQTKERLMPGGYLLFEISPMLKPAVKQLLAGQTHWSEPKFTNDLAGLPRVVELKLS